MRLIIGHVPHHRTVPRTRGLSSCRVVEAGPLWPLYARSGGLTGTRPPASIRLPCRLYRYHQIPVLHVVGPLKGGCPCLVVKPLQAVFRVGTPPIQICRLRKTGVSPVRRSGSTSLPTRIRATNPTPQTHRLVHQPFQPQPIHQHPSRQQPRISHQPLIVENHLQPINVLRYSTHRKCLPTLSQYPLVIRILSQVRGTFLHQSNPSTPN